MLRSEPLQLASFDKGVPIRSLLRGGETPDNFVPVICLLLFHDWIGVSKAGDSVWLLSDARKRLPG